MAEYTRDIKQLQREASQPVNFAPPSASLGGDIVNLIGTGLDFYSKEKAKDELRIASEKQSAQQRQFSQGVLGLRNQRQELQGQGLSSTAFRKREQDFLGQYSPEMQMAIIKETNTITGTNTGKMLDVIDKEEKAKVSERKSLEEGVVGLANYITTPIDLSAGSEALTAQLYEGTISKASTEKKKAEAALRSTQLSNIRAARSLDAEAFLIEYGTQAGNVFTKEALNIADTIDLSNPQQVQEARNLNNEFKQNFVDSATQTATYQGIVLNAADVTTQLASQMEIFDEVDAILSGKDIAEQSTNRIKGSINSMILYMQNSENPTERKLGRLIALGEVFPENSAITNQFQELYVGAMVKGLGDKIFTLQDRATEGNNRTTPSNTVPIVSNLLPQAFEFVKNVFKNAPDNLPTETKEVYTGTMLEDLQGSNATRERLLNNGGLVAYTEAIAKGNPENIIAEEKQSEVLQALMSNSTEFMRRAIPKILQEEQLLGFKEQKLDNRGRPKASKGRKPILATGEDSLNPVNPDTLRLTFPNPSLKGRNMMVKYNKYVDDTLLSLEKLGATEDEVIFFKNEVLAGFNQAPTPRTDTN